MSMLATTLLMLALQAMPLQGIVFKKGTTEPLANATVELRRDQENAGVAATITTEDDGRFLFESIAPGRYRISVTRRGYVRPPLTITVAANQASPEIRLPMTQTGVISGRVHGPSGQPLGSVEVLAMKATYPEGRRVLTPVQSAVSNDLGEYRLFWLAPGRYYVSAIHPEAQPAFRGISNVHGTSISFSTAGNLFHTAATSDPALGGFEPELETESQRYAPVFYGGTTDDRLATSVDIRAGTEAGGVNILVAPVQPRHVRGIVIDGLTGAPAQYASLTIATVPDGPGARTPVVNRERGTFDLVLLPGIHTVYATSASGEGSLTFQLGDADIESLTIPTTPAFEIPGRAALEGEPGSAATLGPLRITLRHYPPREEPRISSFSYATILPDGSFTLSASAGDYRVNIAPLLSLTPSLVPITLPPALQNAYVKSITLGNNDVLNGTLRIQGKPSASLQVVIGRNAGAIDGQVVTKGQTPAADISVVLVPNVRHRAELYRTTTSDISGRFHFDRVPPGEYKIFAWEDVEDGDWFDREFLAGYENRGTPVQASEGRRESVRIEAIP